MLSYFYLFIKPSAQAEDVTFDDVRCRKFEQDLLNLTPARGIILDDDDL